MATSEDVAYIAAATALVAFAAALAFERGLVRLLGASLLELEWISDVVLAVAFVAFVAPIRRVCGAARTWTCVIVATSAPSSFTMDFGGEAVGS